MALEDDIAAMNRNRVQRGMCLTTDDLAMQVQSHQGYLTNIVNELVEQIDIIETGGGVKIVVGQASDDVTGSDFQIYNIVSLTDGFTAPSAPLDVVNILSFSCNVDTYVYAVLNPTTDEWLGWTDTGGIGGVLLIGGLTTATVDSLDTTFTIDNIISFTSGYTHPTSPQTVVNTFGRDLANNQPVYAIYRPDNDTWETWVDTDVSGGGGGGSYLAGYGLELDGGDTFRLDNNGYLGTDFELPGSLDDGTFSWDTIPGWLETLSGRVGADTQVIGHDVSGEPSWFGMASMSVVTADGVVTSDDAVFDFDTTLVKLCGVTPGTTEVENVFDYDLGDGTPVLIARDAGATDETWYAIGTKGTQITFVTEITSLEIVGTTTKYLRINFKTATARVLSATDPEDGSVDIEVTEC